MTPPGATSVEVVDGLSVTRRAGGAPTVVLVHGAMDRAASFGRVMRRLPELDRIALDRRGYGGSVGVASTLEDHVDDLVAVLDHSGAERAVVVGHSLGGRIALQLAARGDARVASVAAFEAPAPDLEGSRDSVGGGAIEVGIEQGPAAAAEHFYRRMVGEATWDRIRDRDREARRSEGPALLAELVDLRDGRDEIDLAAIEVPVLLGVGERSGERLRSGAHALLDRLPNARLVEIAGAGHGAHLTHPDEFARWVQTAVGLAR